MDSDRELESQIDYILHRLNNIERQVYNSQRQQTEKPARIPPYDIPLLATGNFAASTIAALNATPLSTEAPTLAATNQTPLSTKAPKIEDNNLVNWSGPDDAGNPQNMAQWRKWMITWLLSFLNIWVTFSSTIFASAAAPVAQEYHVSQIVTTLGVSLTVLVSSLHVATLRQTVL